MDLGAVLKTGPVSIILVRRVLVLATEGGIGYEGAPKKPSYLCIGSLSLGPYINFYYL